MAFALRERRQAHKQALHEIRAGQKKGHWIWWVFPPLRAYGKDKYTPDAACLNGLDDACAYLQNEELRSNFLEVLSAASVSMARSSGQAPWCVFDSKFGRKPRGQFTAGPVDAFKVRACATLFAAAAHANYDAEVHAQCLSVLNHFTGDCAYSDKGSGSQPDRDGACGEFLVALDGPDQTLLKLIGHELSVLAPMADIAQATRREKEEEVKAPAESPSDVVPSEAKADA